MAATTKSRTVVVVGGGLSGLTAARQLLKDGHHAIVLDKGRSVGGRCATRRIGLPGAIAVDSGAQFFPAPAPNSTSAFATTVQEWKNAGLLASSEVHLNHLNPPNQPDDPAHFGHIVAVETDQKGGPKRKRFSLARRWQAKRGDPTSLEVHFVPHRKVVTDVAALHNSDVGGMNTLARFLETRILELNGAVEPNTQVTKLEIKGGKWIVKAIRHDTSAHATTSNTASDVSSSDDLEPITQETPQNFEYEADAVILTQPVVQALDLIRKSNLEKPLPESTESQLNRIKYDPCISMLVHFPKAPAIGPGHPRERILGVHVLNPAAVALATHQQTTAQGPALTWVGIQSIKRSARPAQLPRSWAENVVVAAQAVGKLLQNADIVGGLAAGSGFLPPPPAAEESKPENKEQPKETQSEPSSDAATAQATETQPNRSDESGAQKVDKTKSQKEDPPKSSTIENSDTNSDTAEMTPDGASDGIDAETPQPTPIAEAQGPQSTFEEEPHPGGETLVVQGDAVWSARMYEAEDTDIGRSMLGEVTKVFDYMAGTPAGQFGEDGDAKALRWWVEEPEIVSIKKWKYAYSVAPDEGVIVADGGAPAIEGAVKKTVHGFASADVGAPLFFAGDAFGYRLIETHVPGETAQSVPAEHAATVAAVSTTGADGATAAAAAVATASTTTVPAEQNEKQSQVNAVSETADAKAEAKEKGATVWSGFGSEVGGRGIEAAILSGAKVATAVSTTFTQ